MKDLNIKQINALKTETNTHSPVNLRQQAEELHKKKSAEAKYQRSEIEILRLINELEVHQIELELQNEELRLAKEQAENITEKYIELYDFAPSGYITLSSTGKIEKINFSGARMLGKDRSHLINSIFIFFISNNTRPAFITFFNKLLNSNSKEVCEIALENNSNQPIFVYIEGIVADNREQCFLTMVDITAQKLATELLDITNRQKNLILEAAGEGIIGIDIEGNYTFINPAAINMLGYDKNELQGKNFHAIVHHQHPHGASYPSEDCPVNITLLTGKPYYGEEYFWRKDNTGFPVLFSSLPILEEYKITGTVVTFQDISDLKKVKEDLLKAEESNRFKTAFLQNMSHEIRTPMNAIMGFSSLIVENFNNKPKLEKFSEIIYQRCNDLLDIINDILDVSKIESGQMPVHLEECNLSILFNELQTFFLEYQLKQEKQHIQFSLNILHAPEDLIIITDKVKLKQILINLISNAFKFTESGKIEGGCKIDDNSNLLFYISDTGIGIPHDKQKAIFDRFCQLNQNVKKKSGGTGLGLSIVKGLIDLLGGEIFLESEPYKGSTFYFTLPLKQNCEINE
jgi:PAS domain S-box-containing protein